MLLPKTHDANPIAFRKWSRPGKVRQGLLLWLLGVPLPFILLFFLIRGCVA